MYEYLKKNGSKKWRDRASLGFNHINTTKKKQSFFANRRRHSERVIFRIIGHQSLKLLFKKLMCFMFYWNFFTKHLQMCFIRFYFSKKKKIYASTEKEFEKIYI